jgi:hypothetical protein
MFDTYTVIWKDDGDDYMLTDVLVPKHIDPFSIDKDMWVDQAYRVEYDGDLFDESNLPSIVGYKFLAVVKGPLDYIA